jgi:predicted NAD-dependent protein-ADP-ribosyltransferase YbiA (DUF1768 family)
MAVTFFSGKKEFRSLSNFWEKEITLNGRTYETGEHCFHGEKYTLVGELNQNQKLIDYGKTFQSPSAYKTPNLAKKMGKGLRLSESELIDWYKMSLDVQKRICQSKLQHHEVHQDLLKSGDRILIHPAMRCSDEKVKERIWEGRAVLVDGELKVFGANQLGEIWMDFRKSLK